jgi:phage repressor protein C with HTH and peptisase S24 domain
MKMPDGAEETGLWVKRERDRRGLSARELADRINGLCRETGDPTVVSQQVVSKFEQGKTKKLPAWTRFVIPALEAWGGESHEDPHLSTALADDVVSIRLLPNFAGMGGGGSDDGEEGVVVFLRHLIERELGATPSALLAMLAEGNSMEPDFRGGDQILVDTRRKSLAQPGAFCLWDGDGHVIKFIERIPESDPAKIRLLSANGLYAPQIRLLEEVHIVGRVVWFGRRVQ